MLGFYVRQYETDVINKRQKKNMYTLIRAYKALIYDHAFISLKIYSRIIKQIYNLRLTSYLLVTSY